MTCLSILPQAQRDLRPSHPEQEPEHTNMATEGPKIKHTVNIISEMQKMHTDTWEILLNETKELREFPGKTAGLGALRNLQTPSWGQESGRASK